eukprot:GHVH01004164.1.p1 GENE.GHVH01004164.1~~GHVH01004164.1.p1  ORF type:complete len:359 (+),score=27.74 GHVH01004164.1:50-1126(+)
MSFIEGSVSNSVSENEEPLGPVSKTPAIFRNRWVRFVFVFIALYFSTCWFYGWQYLYRLLVDSGTFSWDCDDCNSGHPGWDQAGEFCVPIEGEAFVCKEQDNSIQALYTIMSSMEFVGGLFAGYLYDMVGFRVSLVVGYILHLFGIFCVCQSSQDVPLHYVGAFSTGLAVNINSFPAYFIKSFFPRQSETIVMFNIAAQWSSSTVAMFMYESGLGVSTAQMIYSCVGIPLVVVYYLCLPKNLDDYHRQLVQENYVDPSALEQRKTKLRDVVTAFKQWDVSVFTLLWYLPIVMASNSYTTCIAVLAGDSTSKFLGNVQSWQFLFTILFGLLAMFGTKHIVARWFSFFITVKDFILVVLC